MATKLPLLPFVVLDTETTGLTPRSDHVVELALIRFENGEKVAEFESLFKVQTTMSPVARVLTRLTEQELQQAPEFLEGMQRTLPLLDGAVMIGQNLGFDLDMLKGDGMDLTERPWIDSSMIASIVFPEAASFSLAYLSALLDLPHEPKHRAMGDVAATIALIEKTWERLQELPKKTIAVIKEYAENGPEGYAGFFAGLEGDGKNEPPWLKNSYTPHPTSHTPHPTPKQSWKVVKNLDATLKTGCPKGFHPIFAPQFVLDPDAAKKLKSQETFTADELTLVIKLLLYHPKYHRDFPIHGKERDVWQGKLACTGKGAAYTEQFDNDGAAMLDHRQFLELLLHEHEHAPEKHASVVIEDASMLEDTATKAFKRSCSTDVLRAAAEGNAALTSFLDAYQLWIETVRNFQDIRYLVEADCTSRSAKDLRERLQEHLRDDNTDPMQEQLHSLDCILDPKNLKGRITYIEQFRDGGQTLQSVPLDVASLLEDALYGRMNTTLLLPPGDRASFVSILPSSSNVNIMTEELLSKPQLRFPGAEFTLERLLPRVDGRVVCLVGSKRTIEQLAVKHTEQLEEQGVPVIAQGLSGGQGRMQAEFMTAGDKAVWFLTPWMYEGVKLPAGFVDHLWIATLPFDHPSHAILSRRAERYGNNAFDLYFVPRLLQRLFRVVRTYTEHRKDDGDILMLDERVRTKGYGGRVVEYLKGLTE